MNSNWKSEIADLHRSLDVLKGKFAERDHYYHTIVYVEGEPNDQVLEAIPNNYASTDRLVDRTVVKLPFGGYHLHFTFDNNPDDSDHQLLRMLQGELATVGRYLSELPRRRFPQFEMPTLENGATESWLKWLYLLHWLPKLQKEFRFERPDLLPSGLYEVHFEYLDSCEQFVDREKFKEWECCSASNELDPCWVTIPVKDPASNPEKWTLMSSSIARPTPQVVSASISKQLLLSSWESARFILQVAEVKSAPRNKNRKKSKEKGFLDDNSSKIINVLLELHQCNKEPSKQCSTPYTIAELAKLITKAFQDNGVNEKWGCSRTQRAMDSVFERIKAKPGLKPMIKYRRLCEENKLCTELDDLKLLEDASFQRALNVERLDAIKTKKMEMEQKEEEEKQDERIDRNIQNKSQL